MNSSAKADSLKMLALWCAPIFLIVAYLFLDPFAQEFSVKAISIDGLTRCERANIAKAAKSLNGCVLKPGETFSFNRVVGPRTFRRGYALSPSYLNSETPSTFGGGICVVSSLLYQVALKNGLTVVERHEHTRPMKIIRSGMDATVWYGGPDLKFTNSLSVPIQIRSQVEHGELRIALAADRISRIHALPGEKLAQGNL